MSKIELKLKHGPNLWRNDLSTGSIYLRSADQPGPEWYPAVNWRRVHGVKFLPYENGSPEWRRRANQLLTNRAFETYLKGPWR